MKPETKITTEEKNNHCIGIADDRYHYRGTKHK